MDIIAQFIQYLRLELNRSEKTTDAYGLDLRQFADYLISGADERERDHLLTGATTSEIRAWLASEAREGVQPRSLRRKTQSLRAFYKWLLRRDVIRSNPADDIILAKTPRHLPEFAQPTQLEDYLDTPYDKGDEDATLRHLVINILYSTGMRQAELLAINDSDINHTTSEVRITGKRDKQRIIPLPPPLLDEITAWQRLRDNNYPDRPTTALLTHRGKRLSKKKLYLICREMLQLTGATRLGPHTLRHTFATAMVDAGADLNAVREILGHESLSTTQIYTHLSFSRLSADYVKAHPRANPKKTSDNDH